MDENMINNYRTAFNLCWDYEVSNKAKYPTVQNGQNDIRVTIFGMSVNILNSFSMTIKSQQRVIEEEQFWKEINIGTLEDIAKLKKELEICTFQGYFLLFFSRIEWSLKNILVNIKPGACNNGNDSFKNIYGALFKEIGTQNHTTLFDLARTIRNLIHSNGVYQGNDISIPHNAQTYEFKNGRIVENVTQLSLELIKDMVLACIEIIKTPKVLAPKEMYAVVLMT